MERFVRVGRLPGRVEEIKVKEDAAVVDVLAMAKLTPDGYEVRLNGEPADIRQRVQPGDTVLLVKQIKGN